MRKQFSRIVFDRLRKWLDLKWVWFRPVYSGYPCQDYLGMSVLGRWVVTYYKGSVVMWSVSKLVIKPSDSIENLKAKVMIHDYVARDV